MAKKFNIRKSDYLNKEKIFTNKKYIILIAIVATLLWGSAYPSIKVGYLLFEISANDIGGKLLFAGYRFLLAGIFVLIYEIIFASKNIKINKKDLKEVTILGLLQTSLQYLFFYIGLAYTLGSIGSILNSIGTFISIILAHFIYKNDKIDNSKILGCIVGFVGLILVNLDGTTIYLKFSFLGEGFIIIAAILSSISSIYSKKITANKSASLVTGYQLAIGGLILIISGYLYGGKLNNISYDGILLLIYMALLSSVAFGLWSQLLKYNKISTISVYNLLIPIFGTLLSGIILKENIYSFNKVISLVFVTLGIYLVNFKRRDKINDK